MSVEGVVIPNVTPMDSAGGKLAGEATAMLTDFLIAKGVNTLFVGGTTGEGPLLSVQERKNLTECVVAAARGRAPTVVQVGATTTRDTLELALHAAETGASALACLTPYYFAVNEHEMERFFLTVAREVAPLGVYLYNIPSRTGNHLAPALVERLSQETNIVGIKDSTGDLAQLLNLLAIPEVRVLPGADHLIVQTLQAGAAGFVSGPANVLPEPYVALWKAWENKDYAALCYWQDVIVKVSKLVHFGARIDLLKALAAHRLPGIGSVRAPLMMTDAEELAQVRAGLRHVLAATSLPEEAYGWL